MKKDPRRFSFLPLLLLLLALLGGCAAQAEHAAAEVLSTESAFTASETAQAAFLTADAESPAEGQPLSAVRESAGSTESSAGESADSADTIADTAEAQSAAEAAMEAARRILTGSKTKTPPVPLIVTLTVPEAVTVTADNPTASLECAVTRTGDGPDTAQFQVYQNGELVRDLTISLTTGTGTVNLTYAFTRYMTQTGDTVRYVLSYGDKTITAETAVTLENWPDEVYAQKSGAALPYSIEVVRNHNVVLVYGQDESGAYTQLVKTFLCSTGQWTPLGNFTAKERYTGWRTLFANAQHTAYCYGQYAIVITGNYLFHSVPYYSPNKGDLEYEEYNKLGTTASLGCIRLAVADVKWIYDNCPYGTPVSIVEREELGVARPEATYIDPSSPNRGWDPTDPDPENPWR